MPPAHRLIAWIDAVNNAIGRYVSHLALLMVLAQFGVVVLRYAFGLSFIWMQESVIYLHATLFMMGASYTLLHEGHVRVDIFYRTASPRKQALVDLIGSIFFLLPVCGLILWAATPYVASAWSIFEGSPETSGIHAVFLLKSLIIAFAALMGLQGVSLGLRSSLALLGQTLPAVTKDGAKV